MKLSIVYINDVHGYAGEHPELFFEAEKEVVKTVGGYSRLAHFIRRVREANPHTLVFDGGDTFHGTRAVVESKGALLVPLLQRLGISAMVGHWDFAYGPDHLKALLGQLDYPMLGINVYRENGALFLPPYRWLVVGSVKIAVIGICCQIIDKTMPAHFSKGLHFTTGKEELPRYIQEVRAQGAQLVILLSHNGFPQDFQLLSEVPGVDLCLSAHTHNRLYQPAYAGSIPIVQCGCHGSFAGHLELEVGAQGMESFSYRLVPMDEQVEQDPEMETLVRAALDPYREAGEKIVGETPRLLHRYNELNSSMDQLLLAALADVSGCTVAFSNGWRYGVPLPEGKVTMEDLYNIIPMNPPVSTVDLTGEEILGMLEENLERTFSSNAFAQMGGYVKRCLGIKAWIKLENPRGYRIQQLYVAGAALEKERIYKVAFVTEQGVPPHLGAHRKQLPVSAVAAMVAYVQSLHGSALADDLSFVTV